MAKKIILLLSRKSFNELREIELKVLEGMPEILKEDKDWLPDTYEEYLKREKEHPTNVLFG